jgi:hypothetical protein
VEVTVMDHTGKVIYIDFYGTWVRGIFTQRDPWTGFHTVA